MKDTELINSGFARLNKILMNMIDCSENKDKNKLMNFADNFKNDSESFIALLYDNAGIDDDDIEIFSAIRQKTEDVAIEMQQENPQVESTDGTNPVA